MTEVLDLPRCVLPVAVLHLLLVTQPICFVIGHSLTASHLGHTFTTGFPGLEDSR